jgi:ribosomal protein S18 acetylase RimI-like enzyme
MIKIKKLTERHLKDAKALANSVFRYEKIPPGVALEASLDKQKLKIMNLGEKNKISTLEYFIAVDGKEKLLGISGLYSLDKDKENTYWLGWYCVDPKHRGKGIGGKLLDFAIRKARNRGKKFLRLYTSPSDDSKKALKVYDSRGFKTIGRKKDKRSKYEIIHQELIL